MAKRKSIEVAGESIPVLEDVATLLYLADETGRWPLKPLNYIRADLPWLTEGTVLELEDLNPGNGRMGDTLSVIVLQVRTKVQLHQGKYGQVIRRVLVGQVPDQDDMDALFAEVKR